MRVVITGASGNVGTALLRVLPAKHHVVGVVRRPPAQQGVYQRADWCSLDLTEHDAIAELRRVFERADVVVHLAWGFQPTRDTRYLSRLGVGGTSAVLQAADASSVGQLVHMSSVGTYAAGSYGKRVDESWPTTGIHSSPYSRDKSAAEAILDEYEQQLGSAAVPIARMRPGFILQRSAASGLMRYVLPEYVPMQLVPLLPAFTVPLLDCSRARRELGWVPKWTSTDALADLLAGVAHRIHTDSPPLRQRSMLDLLRRDVTEGLISSRRLP